LGEDGRIVRSVAVLATGSVLVTRFADGTAVSEIRDVDVNTGGSDAPVRSADREEHG
jgi:hypothetical protein